MTDRRSTSPSRGWPLSPLWHLTHHFSCTGTHHRTPQVAEKTRRRLSWNRKTVPFKLLLVVLVLFLPGDVAGEMTGDLGCTTPAISSGFNATPGVISHTRPQPEQYLNKSSVFRGAVMFVPTTIRARTEYLYHPSIKGTTKREMKSDKQTITMPISLKTSDSEGDKERRIMQLSDAQLTRGGGFNDDGSATDLRSTQRDKNRSRIRERRQKRSALVVQAPPPPSSSSKPRRLTTVEVASPVGGGGTGGVNEQLKTIISNPQNIWKKKTHSLDKFSFAPTSVQTSEIRGNRTTRDGGGKYKNNESGILIPSDKRPAVGMRKHSPSMNTNEALHDDPPSSWRVLRQRARPHRSPSPPLPPPPPPSPLLPLETSQHHRQYFDSDESTQKIINSYLPLTTPSSDGSPYTLSKSTWLEGKSSGPLPLHGALSTTTSPLVKEKRERRGEGGRGGEREREIARARGISYDTGKRHSKHWADQTYPRVGTATASKATHYSESLSADSVGILKSMRSSKTNNNDNNNNNTQEIKYKEDLLGKPSSMSRPKRKADMLEISVMEGGLAELPCDVHVTNPNDSVQLILWIKEGIHTPLYSYDYRELQGGRPKEMKPDVNSTMAQRTSFRTDRSPAALLVEKVEADDAGIYRCRADFSLSPTINRRVNLTVIVPPRKARVSWRLESTSEAKAVVDRVAGPFLEQARPTLICFNEDGWPPASVSWYENDLLVDDSYSFDGSRGVVENELTMPALGRRDLGRQLTCLASNNNSTQPASITITIAMTLSILGVKVDEIGRVWAGDRTEVECWVWGSKPPPTIVWWLGPHMRTPAQNRMMDEGNLTISVLTFTPTPKEDGVMLICQATNDELPDQAVQDSRLLSVNYAPVVEIRLGPSLDPERIKEGDDVYFECSVKAKPAVFKVIWKQNGVELSGGDGVFVSNMSLVVQRVTRSHAGDYTCEATNIRDTTSSPPIHLDVKYTPLCIQSEKTTFAVARKENAIVSCMVDANPANVSFSWTFNNSAEAILIPQDRFVVVKTESRVSYTPMDEMDYGSLQCWANNTIGTQTIPCIYKIIPAGKPDPPHNCKVSDVTISSLQVNCLPGDDGGLNQTFHLRVYKIGANKSPVSELKRPDPSFGVANLRPATPYRFVITAVNKMGPSRITELKTYTARVPETQQETNAEPTRDRERETGVPLVVMVGAGVVLVPLIVLVIVIIRLKVCRTSSGGGGNNGGRRTSAHSMDAPSTDLASDASAGVDECDPDILSHTPVTKPCQWTEVGGEIATLPTPIYNPPNGGPVYSASIGSLASSKAPGHPRGHPISHPPLHTTGVAATSQVPYYTDAYHSQPTGNVAVLSASSFTQEGHTSGHNIQTFPHPPQTYPPPPTFSHICHPVPSCMTQPQAGSQYGLPQVQGVLGQAPLDSCPPPHSLQGTTVQREGSSREDSQRSYSTPLSPSQMTVSLVKNELIQPPGSYQTGKVPGGTLKRAKGRSAEEGMESDEMAGSRNQSKVESSV